MMVARYAVKKSGPCRIKFVFFFICSGYTELSGFHVSPALGALGALGERSAATSSGPLT